MAHRARARRPRGGLIDTFCTGVEWETGTCHSVAIWSLYYLGRVGELGRRFALFAREAEARGNVLTLLNLGSYAAFARMLAEDDPGTARRTLEELVQKLSRLHYQIPHVNCLTGMCAAALYCGDGAEAWRLVESQWPDIARSRLLRLQVLRGILYHLRARAALAAAETAAQPAPLLRRAAADRRRLRREHHASE